MMIGHILWANIDCNLYTGGGYEGYGEKFF